jgi:hypothetical protein
MAIGDKITVTFPSDTTVPAYGASTYATGAITLQGADVSHGDVAVSGRAVTITTRAGISGLAEVTIIVKTTAGIKNPTAAGAVALTVYTSAETNPVTSVSYTITAAPTVTAIAPASGTTTGGTAVTITGTNFLAGATVTIGGADAAGVFVNATTITATTPAGTTGAKDVVVTTTSGVGTLTGGFTYTVVPAVTSVAPPQANAGETMSLVTIGGTGFTGATAVSFGSGVTVSNIAVATDGLSLTVTVAIASGATAGTRSVTVTTPVGTNVANTLFTVAAANTNWVDRFNSSGVYQTHYATITLAIAGASATDILKVHTGTYSTGETFPIIINKAITLKSMSGAGSTIIGPPDTQANPNNIVDTAALMVPLMVTHVDVTIGGSGAGFTIITRTVAGIWAPNTGGSATGLQILYNTFQVVTQGEARGIWLEATFQADTTQNAIIDHNDFSQATGYSATGGQGDPGTGILIVKTALGSSTRALITNNTAANQRYAFLTFKNERKNVLADGPGDETITAGSTTVEGVDVYGNVVNNNAEAMEFARKGSGTESLTIGNNLVKVYKNQFYSNGEGIRIVAASGSSTVNGVDKIKIESNDIYSNTKTCAWWQRNGYGVENGQSTAVDAQYNWWGSIGGPAAGTGVTAFGAGDKVSTYVTYDPWLTVTYATYAAGGIRSYGSDAIGLAVGWNTLSVPTNLKTSADTFGEIEGIGTFLTTTNLVSGYWYDAATSTWMSANATTQLVPGRGFYINMSAASKFPVLYFDGSLGTPPSYSLSAGWNLIGSMFGVDKVTITDFGVAATGAGNGQKLVSTTLASLGASATNVISPSVPGQVAAWAVLASDGSTYMQVGEAYWVFMSAGGTLAGFEVTPYYFTWAAPTDPA